MAKTKQTRRMIAMALAAAVVMSTVPATAFAADGDGQQTENNSGSDNSGSDNSGSDNSGSDNSGSNVAAASENNNAVAAAEGGNDLPSHIPDVSDDEDRVTSDGPIDITVTIPGDNPDTTKNESEGTFVGEGDPENTLGGNDIPDDENDMDEYDYTIVTDPSKVTVETTEDGTDEGHIEYVTNATDPSGNDDDLVYEGIYSDTSDQYNDLENFLPGVDGEENVTDPAATPDTGFDPKDEVKDFNEYDEDSRFEVVGQGATSQFRPLSVYTAPMSDEEKFEQVLSRFELI